jgi:glutamate dehydrogenase
MPPPERAGLPAARALQRRVAASLAQALKEARARTDVRTQTLVADGPLARVYLIAHAARYPLDLETDIQQPLLSVLDGWHDRFAA